MESHNILEKQIGSMRCITGILAWDKVCHLQKSFNYQNMESLPLCVVGNPNTKSMLIASQGLSGIGNG
jgi:hypothetical protein